MRRAQRWRLRRAPRAIGGDLTRWRARSAAAPRGQASRGHSASDRAQRPRVRALARPSMMRGGRAHLGIDEDRALGLVEQIEELRRVDVVRTGERPAAGARALIAQRRQRRRWRGGGGGGGSGVTAAAGRGDTASILLRRLTTHTRLPAISSHAAHALARYSSTSVRRCGAPPRCDKDVIDPVIVCKLARLVDQLQVRQPRRPEHRRA